MKAIFAAQAARIDALSLRERVIMFASVAIALAALADALVLSPALAERRNLTTQLRAEAKQIDALRAQITTAASDDDSPQARLKRTLDAARTEQRTIDEQIRSQLAGREDMARLPVVLDRLLRGHDRLTLTRLSTASEPPRGAAAEATATTPAVRWQGVDLGVSGNYADLVQYLAELERALPGLRWGPLQIVAPTLPPELSVRLMLVGEAP